MRKKPQKSTNKYTSKEELLSTKWDQEIIKQASSKKKEYWNSDYLLKKSLRKRFIWKNLIDENNNEIGNKSILKRIYAKNKAMTRKEIESNIVYKVSCSNCVKAYIGPAVRFLIYAWKNVMSLFTVR